ncbi:MAG: efflux RND transporter periplasmic adaptor subunit [Nitrospirota bacterium]
MNRKKWLLVAAVLIVLAAASAYITKGLWLHFMPPKLGGAGTAADKDKCKEVYTCPMHPQIIREKPGDCPICGMTLVKKKLPQDIAPGMSNMSGMEGMPGMGPGKQETVAASELKRISLDPRERTLANVATTKVIQGNISQDVDTVGRIALDETSIRRITARYGGRIERAAIGFPGQYAQKGQEIAAVYSPELISAQKEYLIAKGSQERLKNSGFPEISSGTEGVLDAARTRLRLWDMTEAQIKGLDETGKVKNSVSIYSPVSGTVTDIKVRQGDYVSEGAEMYTVADLSRVWMQAEVYEYEFSKISTGSNVEVTADAYPGKTFHGRVSFIDPSVNPESRTVRVRVELPNPGGKLKPEMFVNARIYSKPVRGVIVPASSVLYTGRHNISWVESEPGVFEMREVQLGLRSGDSYQVLSGLRPGEMVVTQGGFLIDSEAQLRESAGGGMAGMPGMSDNDK